MQVGEHHENSQKNVLGFRTKCCKLSVCYAIMQIEYKNTVIKPARNTIGALKNSFNSQKLVFEEKAQAKVICSRNVIT